jgi:autotransporter translocation and assembly factor TamB
MAGFTKINGTTQPVFHMDTANGNIQGTANIANTGSVNFQGPKLDFFSFVANGALTTSGNVNGYINNIMQAVQTKATVAMYQVSPAAPTVLNLALYPTGAYTNVTLLATANASTVATGGQTLQLDSCAGNAVFTTSGTNFNANYTA